MKPPAKRTRQVQPTSACLPAEYDIADAAALKALDAGTATPEQQKRALNWIVYRAAGTYDLSYRPGVDGDRETAFAEGRRFAGLQIVKLLMVPLDLLRKTNV